jgi:hypothetical protein
MGRKLVRHFGTIIGRDQKGVVARVSMKSVTPCVPQT